MWLCYQSWNKRASQTGRYKKYIHVLLKFRAYYLFQASSEMKTKTLTLKMV